MAVTALSQPSPYPTGTLSVFVFEDDFPLNGEQDGGGGVGQLNTNNEPGLGGFQSTFGTRWVKPTTSPARWGLTCSTSR